MQPHSFEGIFYVKNAPIIRYEAEDGMFSVAYQMGNVKAEFVMRPSVYLKALKAAQRAAKQFHDRDASVSPIKRNGAH